MAKLIASYGATKIITKYFLSLVMGVNWGGESVKDDKFIRGSPYMRLSMSWALEHETAFQVTLGVALDVYKPDDEQSNSLPKELLDFLKSQVTSWEKSRLEDACKQFKRALPWWKNSQ